MRKQVAETPNGTGIFWKIERAGTEPSYLLGTMNITDPRVVSTPKEAWAPFDNADTVALELESLEPMDIGRALFSYPELPMLTDGTSVKKSQPAGCAAETARNSPFCRCQNETVVAAHAHQHACMREKTGSGGLAPLDFALIRAAHDQGKTVIGLETALEQLESINGGRSYAVASRVLQQMEAGDKLDDTFATMTDMYLDGDKGMFIPLSYQVLGTTMAEDSSMPVHGKLYHRPQYPYGGARCSSSRGGQCLQRRWRPASDWRKGTGRGVPQTGICDDAPPLTQQRVANKIRRAVNGMGKCPRYGCGNAPESMPI